MPGYGLSSRLGPGKVFASLKSSINLKLKIRKCWKEAPKCVHFCLPSRTVPPVCSRVDARRRRRPAIRPGARDAGTAAARSARGALARVWGPEADARCTRDESAERPLVCDGRDRPVPGSDAVAAQSAARLRTRLPLRPEVRSILELGHARCPCCHGGILRCP